MRAREEDRRWLDVRAEVTANSQSVAAQGSWETLPNMDKATLSSAYQELRGRVSVGPG